MKTEPIDGVKNISCLIAADSFDMINGFSIDYMHCILLGTVKKLLSLWLDSKYHSKSFYIHKNHQKILESRIMNIRVTTEKTRKPRSIFNRGEFKANEYRGLLLYYLPVTLPDLLKTKYLQHFQLLSSSIYILLQRCISMSEFELAKSRLIEFVKNFETLYGKENITMNTHMIKHIPTAVENNGPLWSYSLFGFESMNGVVVKANTCNDKILSQLVWKYCMRRTLEDEPIQNLTEEIKLSGKSTILLNAQEKAIFNDSMMEYPENGVLDTHKSVKLNGEIFKSLLSKESTTIDYFIKTKNNVIGAVKFYFVRDFIIYALIENYRVMKNFDHFLCVEEMNTKQLIKFTDISEKLMLINVGRKKYVTSVPNKYEKS